MLRTQLMGCGAMASLAALLALSPAQAQKSTLESLEEYRAMLQDGNPADLYEAKGEALWKQARGPRQVSLAGCDLGKGPGITAGAFVALPRYFADTGKVQDLESRLLTCMQSLQGFDAQQIAQTPFDQGEQKTLTALATWVAAQSKGLAFNVPQSHPAEKLMYQVGKRLFFQRAGPHDFACATCHGGEAKRIRLQDLPNLTLKTADGVGIAGWPAYRVSNGQMWGLQQRLNDCYRQQRFPYVGFASEATVALGVYMGVNSQGVLSAAPAIRR